MARHWTLHDAARESCVSTAAVVGLLQDLQHRSPGRAALGFLGRVLPLDYVTLVEYRGASAPHQLEGHCRTRAAQDTTARCFSLDRSGFFRHDDAAGLAADLALLDADAPRVDLLHYRQREILDPARTTPSSTPRCGSAWSARPGCHPRSRSGWWPRSAPSWCCPRCRRP